MALNINETVTEILRDGMKNSQVLERKVLVENAISMFNKKAYADLCAQLDSPIKLYPEYTDSYFLGICYALLIISYIELKNTEKVVFWTNKLFHITALTEYEYTGAYSPFAKKYLKKLVACYDKCIQKSKAHDLSEALWGKARICHFKKDYGEAENLYKSALEADEKNTWALRMYARLFEVQYKYDDAIKYFDKAIEIQPDDAVSYQMKGLIYFNQKKYKETERIYKQAEKIDGNDTRTLYRLSALHYKTDSDDWKKDLLSSIQKDSCDVKAIIQYAVFVSEENADMAQELYDIAIEIAPYCSRPYQLKAYMLTNQVISSKAVASKPSKAEVTAAEELCKKALELNPYSEAAYDYYIRLLIATDRKGEAEKHWKQQKENCSFKIGYIFTLLQFDNISADKKEKMMQSALREDAYNRDIYNLLAEFYKDAENYADAENVIKQFLKIYHYDDEMNYILAGIYGEQNAYSFAYEYICIALKCSESEYYALYRIFALDYKLHCDQKPDMSLEQKIDFQDSAEKEIDNLLNRDMKNPYWYFLLAELCLYFCFFQKGIEIVEIVEKKNMMIPLMWYIKGFLYLEIGNEKTGLEALKEASERNGKEKEFSSFAKVITTFWDEVHIEHLEKWFVQCECDQDREYTLLAGDAWDDETLKSLWFWQTVLLCLMQYRKINDKDENFISHYTSVGALKGMTFTKDEKKKKENFAGKLRLTTLTPANDPQEGQALLRALYDKGIHMEGLHAFFPSDDAYGLRDFVCMQTSFTRVRDSLTMFRFYGKKDKEEGTGVNLQFRSSYFSSDIKMPMTNTLIEKKADAEKNTPYSANERTRNLDDNKKMSLYWVLYYDRDHKNLVYFPANRFLGVIIPLGTAPAKWEKMIPVSCYACSGNMCKNEHKCDALENYFACNGRNIQFVFSRICEILKSVDEQKMTSALKLLTNIRYLVKNAAFVEERELRILCIKQKEDDDITTDEDNHRVYMDYLPIYDKDKRGKTYLHEVVLGPKLPFADSFKEMLLHEYKKEGIDVLVSKSNAPLA